MFSSNFESRSIADEEVVMRYVQRLHFGKDNGSRSYRYHLKTLDVVGKQLGLVDPEGWEAELDKIDEDVSNQSGET